jgi:hypothetical protein
LALTIAQGFDFAGRASRSRTVRVMGKWRCGLDFPAHILLKRALFRAARLDMPWRSSMRPEPFGSHKEKQNVQDEDQVGRKKAL